MRERKRMRDIQRVTKRKIERAVYHVDGREALGHIEMFNSLNWSQQKLRCPPVPGHCGPLPDSTGHSGHGAVGPTWLPLTKTIGVWPNWVVR